MRENSLEMICVSGYGCDEKALQGGRFCEPHQAQLDRVKAALEEHDYKRSDPEEQPEVVL